MPRSFRRLFRLPWRRDAQIARDVDDELAFHLEMRIAELRARGLDHESARAEALRRFGDVDDAKAYCRGLNRGLARAERRREIAASWLHDLQYALRQLRRSPGFAVVAVLTLALGIGANTAIFSVVHRLLLDPLPFPNGDRMVAIYRASPQTEMLISPSPPLIDAWRGGARTLESISAYTEAELTLRDGEGVELLESARIAPDLTRMLGVRPVRGRAFTPDDARAGAPPVALLGYGLWRRRYGGDSEVIGSTISVDGTPHVIVGVLPRDFDLPFLGGVGARQLYLPLVPDTSRFSAQTLAIVREGITLKRVEEELTALSKGVPEENAMFADWAIRARRPQDMLGHGVQRALLIMLGAVGLVLLIACANVANLLLARATARRRELAVRAALGAGRGRLVRQLLTESAVLAVLGGALGLLLAWRGLDLIVALRPDELRGLDEVRLDSVTLAWTAGVCVLTGLLFGVIPALFATGQGLAASLTGDSRSVAGHTRSRRVRASLVVTEVALSVVLLVGAGLLVRSVRELQRVDIGFEPAGLVTMHVELPGVRYRSPEARQAALAGMLERVRAIPGVTEAALSSGVPPRTSVALGELQIDGRTLTEAETPRMVAMNLVQPQYFSLVRLPLLEGRSFAPGDGGERAVIVNRSLARRYWPGGGALGQRIRLGKEGEWSTIVGVAEDVRVPGRGGALSELQLYWPFEGHFSGEMMDAQLLFRARGAAPTPGDVARALGELDPGIRLQTPTTVEAMFDDVLAAPRFNLALLSTFALLALVLSAIGLYGVIAYSVSQRTREIGIRMALGARPAAVLRLVLRQGAWLTLGGLAIGLLTAALATRAMGAMLYETSPLDPGTFVLVGVVLGLVALGAAYVPARRAARVDPAIALRAD